MDIEYELRGVRFQWNEEKAKLNIEKHGVSFEQAAQVFFDPFVRYVDASRDAEQRDGALGCDFSFRTLVVVHLIVEDEYIRIISARKAEAHERNAMKMATIKRRLAKNRPMVSVTLRMPEDLIADMKRLAPLKGFSGYQTLMRSYVGAGIREDLEHFEGSAIGKLIERLRENGVPEETLIKAASEVAKSDR